MSREKGDFTKQSLSVELRVLVRSLLEAYIVPSRGSYSPLDPHNPTPNITSILYIIGSPPVIVEDEESDEKKLVGQHMFGTI